MANSKQAKKRARQAAKHREHNMSLRSAMRTSIKKVLKAIEEKNTDAAKEAYKLAVSKLDSMTGKGLIHKNKAARHKSRLNKHIKELAQA